MLARRLAAAGVREGSRVALLAGNSLEFAAVVHALPRLGAELVPLNIRLTDAELAWQLRDVGAALLLADTTHAATAAALGEKIPQIRVAALGEERGGLQPLPEHPEANIPLRAEIDLSATQAIIYTSGTTGQPKGARITFGMQWWNAVASALKLGVRADDCWLACLPFFHVGGLTMLQKCVIYGMRVVVFERFDAAAVNQAIERDGVTLISVVTVMLQRMLAELDEQADSPGSRRYPSSLRCVLLGGGPAPRPLLKSCAERGIPVSQSYGLTESCSQAATLQPEDALRKLGSAGRPLLPVQLRVVRDGQPALPGEAGEIVLRGPTITPGYVTRPEETERAFVDGWFATGDIGYLDDEGYLYVLDRRSDLIISGGENVYPAEVEAALLSHPEVEEAGVTGEVSERWGSVPVAYVRLRHGAAVTADALLAHAAARLARYKVPHRIIFTGPLPRNAAGKLLRRELTKGGHLAE